MLSIRKKIAATTVSVLAATAGGAATAQMSPSPAQQKATVGISILPGIIGPGDGVQSAGKANGPSSASTTHPRKARRSPSSGSPAPAG